MGNNQVKQSMKCFSCNEVAFITIKNQTDGKEAPFNIIIEMKCPNKNCLKQLNLTLSEYFTHRHSFRSQRIPCHNCTKHENEMFLCYKCQEKSKSNNPIMYCPKCKVKHQQEEPEHLTLSMNYLNSKCYIHRKAFVAFDDELMKNLCEDCINDENREKVKCLEKMKYPENEIEDMLEKVKLQLAKINTIKMMKLTENSSEMTKFKEYLQKKIYFIELEWLIIGEVVGTPNNYQVLMNIKNLLENKYNTITNNNIFNDKDPIGIKIKDIVDKKNAEKKIIFSHVNV